MLDITYRRLPQRLRCIVVLASLCGFAAPVAAATDGTTCPPSKSLRSQLADQLKQAQETRAKLIQFVDGSEPVDVPPSALFVVNLNDEKSVARRTAALKGRLSGTPTADSPLANEIIDCAQPYRELAKPVSALLDVEMQIARLRLDFLSLPVERRSALLNAQRAVVVHTEDALELEKQRASAEQEQLDAIKSAEAAQKQAKSAKSGELRELAAQRSLLEKTREELAAVKARFTATQQDRVAYYKTTAETLSLLNGQLVHDDSAAANADALNQAVESWRRLVDHIFVNIADPERYERLAALPEYPALLLDRLGESKEADTYRQAYSEVQAQYDDLDRFRLARYEQERDNSYRLLLQASTLRSLLMQRSIDLNGIAAPRISRAYLADVAREIRIVPYQLIALFYGKLLDIRRKMHSGLEGIIDLLEQLLVFVLVLAVPFGFYHLLQQMSEHLNQLRRRLVRRQFEQSSLRITWSGRTALWIQRANPYLPWVITLLGLLLAESMLATTDLAQAAALLPYAELYVWYRIVTSLTATLVGVAIYSVSSRQLATAKERIHQSARHLSMFFFIALGILHATDDVVGHALVYSLVSDLMLYVGTLFCFLTAWRWRSEIGSAVELLLPGFIGGPLVRRCAGRLAFLFCLPSLALLALAVATERLRDSFGEVDLFKRIGAEMFRRRIESAVGKEEEGETRVEGLQLSADYYRLFKINTPIDDELLIEPSNELSTELLAMIERWVDDESRENSALLYGEKGSGKTSLLRLVASHFPELKVVWFAMPAKCDSRDAMRRAISEALDYDLRNGAVIDNEFNNGEKTLILIDEGQNSFLAKLGGFDGYRTFIEIINNGPKHLFWLTAFNSMSWNYLKGVFGQQHFFSEVFAMPPFDEDDIRNMVMTRHNQSTYRLSYDVIISATQTSDEFAVVEQVEHQFFRLLWGQSKGNPRAAILLWLSALSVYRNGVLKVGIPDYTPIRGLEATNDDTLFVFASIMRHENLALQEAIDTVNLAPGTVLDALKTGLELSVIYKGLDGRYRVTPSAQFSLTQVLGRKNFVYG